jgi:hypothetical protein
MVRFRFLILFELHRFSTQVTRDFAELFEGGFQVFHDFLSEDVGIGEIVGFFEAFVSKPEDVEARLIAVYLMKRCATFQTPTPGGLTVGITVAEVAL